MYLHWELAARFHVERHIIIINSELPTKKVSSHHDCSQVFLPNCELAFPQCLETSRKATAGSIRATTGKHQNESKQTSFSKRKLHHTSLWPSHLEAKTTRKENDSCSSHEL